MLYTRANKACQGKTCNLCCTHEQIKLVKEKPYQGKICQFMLYTRANETCQEKLVIYAVHEQIKLVKGKLGRVYRA